MSLSLLSIITLNGSAAIDVRRLALEASSADWFRLVKHAGYAVAFGCALEAPETFVIIKRWWLLRFRNDNREETVEDRRKWYAPAAAAGLLIIVIGILIETFAEGKVSDVDALLRAHESDVITAAENKADAADLKAAGANTLAAADEKEAGKLQKAAEDERMARVKIEARVAWRRLDEKQKAVVSSEVGDFPPLHVGASLWYEGNDTEAKTFGDDIAEALRLSHVAVQPPANVMRFVGSGKFGDPIKRTPTGVSILPSKFPDAITLADNLISALNKLGFDASRRTEPMFKDSKLPEVEIDVETRPDGPQGEYKLHAREKARSKQKHK